MADFNNFGLILQDFEKSFKCNQLVLALQFSFNVEVVCLIIETLLADILFVFAIDFRSFSFGNSEVTKSHP